MARDPNPFQAAPPARPEARAAEGALRPPARHRLRDPSEYVELEEENRLHIPRHLWPDGFALQWVTDSVWGRPETQHRARYEKQGWVSVHADEWDGKYGRMFMPEGQEGEIKMDGLVLMARDARWNAKARAIEARNATNRVSIKERQVLSGDLSGVTLASNHPTALATNSIVRSMEQIPVAP